MVFTHPLRRPGLSLMELLASVTITGVVGALVVTRLVTPADNAQKATCDAQVGDIELQVQLWRRENGSLPAVNLSDIAIDVGFFPEGIPTCPVDGTPYTIDAQGRVVGHNH